MPQLTPAPEQPLSPPNAPETPARHPPNACAQSLGVFLLLVVAILLVTGKKLQLSQWSASADDNAAIAEAMAWRAGRLDLPHEDRDAAVDRMHDTAWYNNKVYNIFPPLMAFLSYAAAPLNQALSGRPDFWQPMLYALLAFGPLPLLGFLVFRRATNSDWRGALITLVWIAGSPLLPALGEARGAYLGSLNHVFSQTGLLLLLWDVLGKRRIWPGLAGLAIAVWSRQMTALYAPALLWAAWRGPADARGFSRNKRAFGTILGLAMIAAPLLTLNYLKFGNPLQFGYGFIYENRSAGYVEDRFRTHGVFSHHFIPENAYYQFVAPPRVALGLEGLHVSETNNIGTGILWTTPIVLWLLIALGTCLAKPNWRTLLLCSLAVMLGDLCYHSPGFLQSGYSRFALDYLPVWLVLAAKSMFDPRCGSSAERCDSAWGWRNWLTVACVAWSLFYFQTITPDAFFRGVVGG